MRSIHDLGGLYGFGAVVAETDEPVFHEEWQKTAFAVLMAAGTMLPDFTADAYRTIGVREILAVLGILVGAAVPVIGALAAT